MNVRVKKFEDDATECVATVNDDMPVPVIAIEFIREHSDGSDGIYFIEVGELLVSVEKDTLADGTPIFKTALVEPDTIREFLKSQAN